MTSSLPSTSTLQCRHRRTMCLGPCWTTRSWWRWWGQVTLPANVSCPWLKPCVQWPVNAVWLKSSWWITTCVPKWRSRSSKSKLSIQRHISSNIFSINYWRSHPDKVGPDGTQSALAYRYIVTPNVNVHCYKPKELGDDVDKKDCRSTELGACWSGRFANLPLCSHCDVVWEVQIGEEVPAVIKPTKPKFYLLGGVSVESGHAVKLKWWFWKCK